MNIDSKPYVLVPIYEVDSEGAVLPNPIFHRPWDKLHSRCIEYPFAAKNLGESNRILDIGTAKSDRVWNQWLESVPVEVHAADYDEPQFRFEQVQFHRCDVRALPFPDGIFDAVLAISVVEHIGLADPQVHSVEIPKVSEEGDLEAVAEFSRVLRPGGRLIMTLPFGLDEGLILGGSARNYTLESLRKFDEHLELIKLEYYEYQSVRRNTLFEEYPRTPTFLECARRQFADKVSALGRLRGLRGRKVSKPSADHNVVSKPSLPGVVTWRRVDPQRTSARHNGHTEGVACGVWMKPM